MDQTTIGVIRKSKTVGSQRRFFLLLFLPATARSVQRSKFKVQRIGVGGSDSGGRIRKTLNF
jgi:hypothetical protein